MQNDKAVIRLSTGAPLSRRDLIAESRGAAEEGKERGKSRVPTAPRDSIGSSPLFPLFLSHHFASFLSTVRRDMSQSRNPKLLNYFPIVVAMDHVCSSPESIRYWLSSLLQTLSVSGALPDRADRKMHAIAFLEKSHSRGIAIRGTFCSADYFVYLPFVFISSRSEVQNERIIARDGCRTFRVNSL